MRKLIVCSALLFSMPLFAGDKLINVQGKLTNPSGVPLTSSQTITFRLYDVSTAPVAAAIWVDTMTVVLSSGMFNVALGQGASLDALPFNKTYYLGLWGAGDTQELSPRQTLGASPYTLGSVGHFNGAKDLYVGGKLGVGLTSPLSVVHVKQATNTNLLMSGGVQATGAFSLNAVNDANSANIPLEIRGSPTVFSGNVGVGSTAPITALEVNGDIFSKTTGNNMVGTDRNGVKCVLQSISNPLGRVGTITNHPLGITVYNTDRIFIDTTGNVGVGTSNPQAKLDLAGDFYVSADSAEVARHTGIQRVGGQGVFWFGGGSGNLYFKSGQTGGGGDRAYLDQMGVIHAADFVPTSTMEVKKDIVDNGFGLQTLLQLRTKQYKLIADPEQRQRLGLIAEEVQQVLPEAAVEGVRSDGSPYLGLSYSQLTAVLIKAVQDLSVQVNTLTTQNQSLQTRIQALENK